MCVQIHKHTHMCAVSQLLENLLSLEIWGEPVCQQGSVANE